KQRLLDRAEIRNAEHVRLRDVVFPMENHVHTWASEIVAGDKIIRSAINLAHASAKKDAQMLENPVTPVDMALDMAGAGVEHLAGEKNFIEERLNKKLDKLVEELGHEERFSYEMHNMSQLLREEKLAGAKKMAAVHKGFEYAEQGEKIVDTIGEHERSRGDKALDIGLELAGNIPGAGKFVKTIAGM